MLGGLRVTANICSKYYFIFEYYYYSHYYKNNYAAKVLYVDDDNAYTYLPTAVTCYGQRDADATV